MYDMTQCLILSPSFIRIVKSVNKKFILLFYKPSNLNRGKIKGKMGSQGNKLVKFSRVKIYNSITFFQEKKELQGDHNLLTAS